MLRSISLAVLLGSATAIGALTIASAQTFVLNTASSSIIDVAQHAQAITVSGMAWCAGLVGLFLGTLPPFAETTASRAGTEGFRAVEAAVIQRPVSQYRYIDTPSGRRKQHIATGRFVPMASKPRRRRLTKTGGPVDA